MNGSIPRVRPNEIDTNTMAVLDVRRHPHKEQIRGAVRYDPKALLTEEPLALPFGHHERIVVYAEDDAEAERIAAHMCENGFANVAVLEGGLDAYRRDGLPTEELTQQQPVPGSESGIPRL